MSTSLDGGPSGLNPTGGFALPDVDSLDAAARSLRQHADDFLAGVSTATALWRGLSSSYSSDESPTVLAAFGTIMPAAQRVQGAGAGTAAALTVFSGTCRDLKLRLEAYGRKVHVLDDDIDAFPATVEETTVLKDRVITTTVQQHWTGEADLTARHDTLAAEVKAIHDDYLQAQDACARSLAAVSGGPTYTVSRPVGPEMNAVDHFLHDAGTFFGIEHPEEEQPWGTQTVPFRPHGTLGLFQGFGAGAIELIDGIWTFTGTEDDLKTQRAFAAGVAAAAALGTLAAAPFSAWDEPRRQREAAEVKEAQDLLGSMGPAIIHAEEAETNPNWAAGATAFNAVGLVGSYGTGAAAKSGALASKAGTLVERLSVSTVHSTRLGNLSAMLGTTANSLYTAGEFLAKPGSLSLKVADILMPNTTAKVIDTMAQSRAATWAAITDAKTTAAEAITGTKHATANALGTLANGLRAAEAHLPAALTPDPSGAMARIGVQTGLPDKLDSTAGSIRANNPPAFVPPIASTNLPTPAGPALLPEHFVRPTTIDNTITLSHGDLLFPVKRGDNFAARTGLEPNTEYIIDHRTTMKDNTGGHTATTLEKFYTDDKGTVTIVDTYAGVKGAWSIELNKPMPNVTYNVIAEVDGGLQNTFTLVMDANAHLAAAKGHITSTLVGDLNRNGWQQLKTGRLGGTGYDGGHAAPSVLGFIGERGGLFPQHEWQNRKIGTPNEIDETNNFHDTEMDVINRVKADLSAGRPVDLKWEMALIRADDPAVPASTELQYTFAGEEPAFAIFNNTKASE